MKKILATVLAVGAATSLTGCIEFTTPSVPATEEQQGQLDDFVFWMTDEDLNTTITYDFIDNEETVSYKMEIDGSISKITIVSETRNEIYYEEFKNDKSIQYYQEDGEWKVEEFPADESVTRKSLVFNMDYIIAEDFKFSGEYWFLAYTETVDDQSFTYEVKVTFDDLGAPTLTMSVKVAMFNVEMMTMQFSNKGTTSVTLPTVL